MNNCIEKIEVAKNNGNFYYTGIVSELDFNWIEIKTIKNETIKLRREQIMQRKMIRRDTNENSKNNINK